MNSAGLEYRLESPRLRLRQSTCISTAFMCSQQPKQAKQPKQQKGRWLLRDQLKTKKTRNRPPSAACALQIHVNKRVLSGVVAHNAAGNGGTPTSLRPSSPPNNTNGWRRDLSLQRQLESNARVAFQRSVNVGEDRMDLMTAALAIEAEDDALTSNGSPVPFPMGAFRQRIVRFADSVEALLKIEAENADYGDDISSEKNETQSTTKIVATAERYLFSVLKFRLPNSSREVEGEKDVTGKAIQYDHPGVHFSPDHCYISRVLTKKVGCAAILAIILDALIRELTSRGVLKNMVKIACKGSSSLPYCVILDLSISSDWTINATPCDSLILVLLHLKRSFWPFAWETEKRMRNGNSSIPKMYADGMHSHNNEDCAMMDALGSGFTGAAKSALQIWKGNFQESNDAYLEAVSRAAAHRLKRGIWTTTGGGDIKRCIVACERLVILHKCGNAVAICDTVNGFLSMRDLGVLYFHDGSYKECSTLLSECQSFLRENPDMGLISDLSFVHEDSVLLDELLQCSLQSVATQNSRDRMSLDNDEMRYTELPW